eukprot:6151685-Pleurochrysis_carterae.AAC.1
MDKLAASGEWVRKEIGEDDGEEGVEEKGEEDESAKDEEVDSSDEEDAHTNAASATADPEP